MQRIALFNIESYTSSAAILRLIERYHERIVLVVTTDRYSGENGSLLKQAVNHYRKSGITFLFYLNYNFLLYFWGIYLSHILTLLHNRKPRTLLTIAELCQKYQIQHIKTGNVNNSSLEYELKQANLDLIIVYYFDQILRQHIIDIPKYGVLNVHAALLPQCRGVFPTFYTALKHDRNFGITVHEITNNSIDAGPILAQKRITVPNEKSVLFLSRVIHDQGVELVSEVIENFAYYYQNRVVQGNGTYFSFPTRKDMNDARIKGIRLYSFREFWESFL